MGWKEDGRKFLRNDQWNELLEIESDEKKGKPAPPVQKPYPPDATLVELIKPEDISVGTMSLREVIDQRRSRRKYTNDSLTLEELSFLLWATQGVREVGEYSYGQKTMRTVPSGGARHPFETYLVINRIDGIEPGLYRYLPLDHKLCFEFSEDNLAEKVAKACCGQTFIATSAVIFIWTAIPYRMEWRYHVVSHKVIAQDAGHLCQNLYLASESIGAGTCAIGAYVQNEIDPIIRVDGDDELVIYIAPVGRIN